MVLKAEASGILRVDREFTAWTSILGGYNKLLNYLEQNLYQHPMTLLDVGTGTGKAYLTLKQVLYGNGKTDWKFKGTALTEYAGVREKLTELHLCDSTELNKYIAPGSVHFLTAVRSVSYTPPACVPLAIDSIKMVLAPGGVARIIFKPNNGFCDQDPDQTRDDFMNALCGSNWRDDLTVRQFDQVVQPVSGIARGFITSNSTSPRYEIDNVMNTQNDQLVLIKNMGHPRHVSHVRLVEMCMQEDYRTLYMPENIRMLQQQASQFGNVYTNNN